ncbi:MULTISPECIES: hypothetical protein [Ruegeria]|uniref:MAPEG family protein n=1 Tax=Ruegeria atlantica TaxID=81569 RepID=A0ABX1WHJ6_9RHOB|nr:MULTISPECIES: hypothetical protein [Ruegeria]NOD32812.1 hypothetical protein [Ruegeria atlantica]
MKEVLPLAVIVAFFVLSLLCFKASRIVENWSQDIRPPALNEFYAALLSRVGLRYFSRHSAVLACLLWLVVAIELFFAGLNAALAY